MGPKKRATMMVDSDNEDDDLFSEENQPKKKKQSQVADVAEGPSDFIETLTDAGYYPRSGSLPNLLSIIGKISHMLVI